MSCFKLIESYQLHFEKVNCSNQLKYYYLKHFNFKLWNSIVIMIYQIDYFKFIRFNYLLNYYFKCSMKCFKNPKYYLMSHSHSSFDSNYFNLCFQNWLKYSIGFDQNLKWMYYCLINSYLNCLELSLENHFNYLIVYYCFYLYPKSTNLLLELKYLTSFIVLNYFGNRLKLELNTIQFILKNYPILKSNMFSYFMVRLKFCLSLFASC